MSVLYNPRWRLTWSAVMAVATALLVGLDWALRSTAGQNFMAARASDLWLSVALGVVLGAVALLWDRYQLRKRRDHLLAVRQTPLKDRLAWRFQRTNLLYNGWLFLAMVALVVWCYVSGVFVLPAVFAMNAVQFAGNRRLAGEFNEELRHRTAA
jgi:hypothetical protein